ncbi:hypothetical protein HY086_00470 [Candidatus Gottesmanbacteria bacterium]|nr:hypothetical protein [Candidatus Gottesmanbacteria bacterium]
MLVKDFINSALEAHKIARAKNNGEELSFFAKKVGSNYFLSGRRLEFYPSGGFLALRDLRKGRVSFTYVSDYQFAQHPSLRLLQ